MISDGELQQMIREAEEQGYSTILAALNELLALRKAATCQHHWNIIKLVECGGQYQYCTLCGAKKVAE